MTFEVAKVSLTRSDCMRWLLWSASEKEPIGAEQSSQLLLLVPSRSEGTSPSEGTIIITLNYKGFTLINIMAIRAIFRDTRQSTTPPELICAAVTLITTVWSVGRYLDYRQPKQHFQGFFASCLPFFTSPSRRTVLYLRFDFRGPSNLSTLPPSGKFQGFAPTPYQ